MNLTSFSISKSDLSCPSFDVSWFCVVYTLGSLDVADIDCSDIKLPIVIVSLFNDMHGNESLRTLVATSSSVPTPISLVLLIVPLEFVTNVFS